MPLSYFDRVSNGEVLSRITNDVDTITQTLNQSLSQIVTNVTMMVGVLCMMLSISPLMTLSLIHISCWQETFWRHCVPLSISSALR